MQAFFLDFVVADNILPSTSKNCIYSEPASSQALKFQKTAKNRPTSENYLLFNKLTTTDQKRIYSTLSTEVRAGLWEQHLTEIINTEQLDQDQLDFLNIVLEFTQTSLLLDETNPLYVTEVIDRAKGFSELSKSLFTMKNRYKYLASFSMPKEKLNQKIGPTGCSCSTIADMCWVRGPCRRTNNCIASPWGCGVLWLNTCNGMCSVNSIP